jgi:hypothetical protein
VYLSNEGMLIILLVGLMRPSDLSDRDRCTVACTLASKFLLWTSVIWRPSNTLESFMVAPELQLAAIDSRRSVGLIPKRNGLHVTPPKGSPRSVFQLAGVYFSPHD